MDTRTWGLLAGIALFGAVMTAPVSAVPLPAAVLLAQAEGAEARLLPIGKAAPDFTLPRLDGGEVTLANLAKGNKAVLIHFWSTEQEGVGKDLAVVQKLNDQFHDKGLAVLTINPYDRKDDVTDVVAEGKLSIPVLIDGKETNHAVTNTYKARMLPTFYLLDPDAKVLWRSLSLKEESLREAITKVGIK